MIASLVYSVVSALWAPAPAEVLSHVQRYALNTVLLATVFAAARSREALRWIATAIACGGALTVALLLIAGTTIDTGRLTDTGVDANELAMTLVASILFGCLLAVQARSGLARLFFVGVTGLDFYGLLLTNSRGGMLAMVAALLAWVVFGGRWRGRLAFGAVIALALSVAYITVVAPAPQRARGSRRSSASAPSTSIAPAPGGRPSGPSACGPSRRTRSRAPATATTRPSPPITS